MRNVVKIAVRDVIPGEQDSLVLQGISAQKRPSAGVMQLYRKAREIYTECCHPIGAFADIDKRDFECVYRGEGRNNPKTPVGDIFTVAERLALFAVTIGHEVHDKINDLFKCKEFALGSMLDSVASAGVEMVADVVEARFSAIGEKGDREMVTMRYSPGYCGWHVSGQKKLFEFLKPRDIGVTLRDSYLMEPLKSVSGVFIQGYAEVHIFEDNYPFCGECETHSCRTRVMRVNRLHEAGGCRPSTSSTGLNEKE